MTNLADWLIAQLGDVAETAIALHALRSGRCLARRESGVLVVEPFVTRGELLAFGDDAAAIARIVMDWPEWRYVEVSPEMADPVAAELERIAGGRVERIRDLYFTLTRDPHAVDHPNVRLLSAADARAYASSGVSYADDPDLAHASVIEGPVVAAFDDAGRIIASAEANVRTARYANLNVSTLPDCRRRGLCTAVTSLACRVIREMGLTPLWSCAETNAASRRVAEKVGFTPVAHCVYLKRPT